MHLWKLSAVLAAVACACLQFASVSTENPALPREGPAAPAAPQDAATPDWAFNATIIEACSCPMFCQCYFNPRPAEHPGCCPPGGDAKNPPRYCRFNNVFRVNKGHHGETKLDGAKFWLGGDLGGDFSKGQMNWAVLHFDPPVTKEQREGIKVALGKLYPVKWESFTVGKDLPVEWNGGKERAEARLDGGKVGHVVLKKNVGMTPEPIVIHNLVYWGAPRNDGFILMAAEKEAYSGVPEKGFEHKDCNGFMITVDVAAKDYLKKK